MTFQLIQFYFNITTWKPISKCLFCLKLNYEQLRITIIKLHRFYCSLYDGLFTIEYIQWYFRHVFFITSITDKKQVAEKTYFKLQYLKTIFSLLFVSVLFLNNRWVMGKNSINNMNYLAVCKWMVNLYYVFYVTSFINILIHLMNTH